MKNLKSRLKITQLNNKEFKVEQYKEKEVSLWI